MCAQQNAFVAFHSFYFLFFFFTFHRTFSFLTMHKAQTRTLYRSKPATDHEHTPNDVIDFTWFFGQKKWTLPPRSESTQTTNHLFSFPASIFFCRSFSFRSLARPFSSNCILIFCTICTNYVNEMHATDDVLVDFETENKHHESRIRNQDSTALVPIPISGSGSGDGWGGIGTVKKQKHRNLSISDSRTVSTVHIGMHR